MVCRREPDTDAPPQPSASCLSLRLQRLSPFPSSPVVFTRSDTMEMQCFPSFFLAPFLEHCHLFRLPLTSLLLSLSLLPFFIFLRLSSLFVLLALLFVLPRTGQCENIFKSSTTVPLNNLLHCERCTHAHTKNAGTRTHPNT